VEDIPKTENDIPMTNGLSSQKQMLFPLAVREPKIYDIPMGSQSRSYSPRQAYRIPKQMISP
jgi:hypothetical protein